MVKVKATRRWNHDDVRTACIRHEWYTQGTPEAYINMLDMVDELEPTYENIYKVALDILEHSAEDATTLENTMFIIERECVDTFFEMVNADEA